MRLIRSTGQCQVKSAYQKKFAFLAHRVDSAWLTKRQVHLPCVCVSMCHPWPWATCTLNRGQSGRGLSPTLGGTGTFVFLPPASCHLQRSHWPSANDLQLSAEREKRWNSSLSTSGFISALGQRFVAESQGKPVCGWDLCFTEICTSLVPQRSVHQQCFCPSWDGPPGMDMEGGRYWG